MSKNRTLFALGAVLLVLFAIFVWAVQNVNVAPIGPDGSEVGFAGINGKVRDLIGVNQSWYEITELLGYGVLLVAAGFCLLALFQAIKRKSLKIDGDLWGLLLFYVVVGGIYLFFEKYVVNYRPIITEDGLEASFPSSHTLLSLCIMGSASLQFSHRIKKFRTPVLVISLLIMVIIVVGRLLSGVHWFTDILGSVLLSAGLVMIYAAVQRKLQ